MADAIAKPIKMSITKNPVKGFIRNVKEEEKIRLEKREERLKKEGKR